MVVLGADLHKRSHTVVVIDATGRQLAEKTIAATDAGHLELRRWAAQWPERTLGSRGLPSPVAAARCRARPGRRVGRAGLAQADGRRPPLRTGAGQERSDRCPRGRPGGPARARPAGRHPRRPRPSGAPPGRPSRGSGRRTDPPRAAPALVPRRAGRSPSPRRVRSVGLVVQVALAAALAGRTEPGGPLRP